MIMWYRLGKQGGKYKNVFWWSTYLLRQLIQQLTLEKQELKEDLIRLNKEMAKLETSLLKVDTDERTRHCSGAGEGSAGGE